MSKANAAASQDPRGTDPVQVTSVTSTEAQNALGELMDRARRGERVFITRYGRRQAVLLSPEAYAELIGTESVDLDELEKGFEARLRAMGTPEHKMAIDELFEMSGTELGIAAVGRDDVQHGSES